MRLNKTIAIAVLLFGLLAGGLVAGVLLSQRPTSVEAAPAVQQATPACTDEDNVQDENKNEADDGQEKAGCDQNEANDNEEKDNNETDQGDKADENSASLQGQTTITADQAKATAEAANPGTKTLAVELDRVNENGGAIIYEVELDNGLDVKVDAANGSILNTEQRDAN